MSKTKAEDCSKEHHKARRHKQMGEGDPWEQCEAGTCSANRAALGALGGKP